MEKNIQTEIKALAALLSKKWSVDQLEQLEDLLGEIRTHTRVTIKQLPAKTNTKKKDEMADHKISFFGYDYQKPPLTHKPKTPKAEEAVLPPEFFALTPDFSEKDFEEFCNGEEFESAAWNRRGSRSLARVFVNNLVGFPGDTVVRYKNSFAIIKKTHASHKHKSELT
jgi:hypothetical protein